MVSKKEEEKTYNVSVVMPVYNGELYLRQCMDSVINQTEKKIQIICVDDGSTDNSLEILEEYAKKDSRITVLNGNHNGAAEARNLGLRYAVGDYVSFLDCDDVFENDMLEDMYRSAKKYQAEIVFCEFDTDMSGKSCLVSDFLKERYLGKYTKEIFDLTKLPLVAFQMWSIAPWSKMYKREFLRHCRLEFQNLKNCNDVYFSVMSMVYAARMIHTSSFKAMVHYRTNTGVQISSKREVRNVYLAHKKIYSELSRTVTEKKIFQQYYVMVLHNTISEMVHSAETYERKKAFYEFFVSEGMNFLEVELENDQKQLSVYKELADLFRTESFESEWFKKKSLVGIQLDIRGYEELKVLSTHSRVALWGLGERGKIVLEKFMDNDVKVVGVIDGNVNKQGTDVLGYIVKSLAQLQDEIEVIVITSKVACDSICHTISRQITEEVKILPLFMYLESDLPLQECIFQIADLIEQN